MAPPPIDLGLVVAVPSCSHLGTFEAQDIQAQILRVQMNTLGGQIYLVSLSVEAARNMMLGIANWPPMQDFLSKQVPPAPTKLQ